MRVTYNAAVEVATKQPLNVDKVSEFGEYHPEVRTSAHGWLEVRLSLSATSLAQACATALSVASAATGAEAIACEVITERESNDRGGFVPDQRTAAAVWT